MTYRVEGNWATVGRRRTGAHRQREKKKNKRLWLRVGTLDVGTLDVGTMTGKAREMVGMMQRRKMDILCA